MRPLGGGSGEPSPARALTFLGCLFLIASGLQSSVAGHLPRFLGEPDLVLTLALVAALLSDSAIGALAGFAAGLITAALVGQTVGTFLVSRTLAGFAAGMATTRLYRGNAVVVVVGVLVASLVSEAAYFLAAPHIGLSLGLRTLLLGPVWNAALALPTLWVLRRCGWGARR